MMVAPSTKHRSAGLKLEKLAGDGYDPKLDTCLKVFVRMLAARASQEASFQ